MKQFSIIFIILAMLPSGLFAGPLEHWTCRSPLPQGNALNNINFVNGTWLAVGEMGTILTSNDGTNWTARDVDLEFDLTSCAYGNGIWVVVGDYGTVLTSSDSISWTQQNAGSFYSLNSVIFTGNQFVAVGENTTILTSPELQ